MDGGLDPTLDVEIASDASRPADDDPRYRGVSSSPKKLIASPELIRLRGLVDTADIVQYFTNIYSKPVRHARTAWLSVLSEED